MFRKVTPGTTSKLALVDHNETYGRHILKKIVSDLDIKVCVDLGCGSGDDLMIVKENNPDCRCIGIDIENWNQEKLISKGIEPFIVNIENESLPLGVETVDLVIANQVLEHTKEIFWINHEIFRVLKKGGYLFLGFPNVLSLHNRILALFGIHPTSSKMISAHVRAFSKRDTIKFYNVIASKFSLIEHFFGSQFYPFPKSISRSLSNLFPSCAFSIFFQIKKKDTYSGEFLEWLSYAQLETNFFKGD